MSFIQAQKRRIFQNMSIDIHTIEAICRQAGGGILSIFAFPMSNIIETPKTGIITGNLTFTDPDKVFSIYFSKGSAQFTESERDSKGGKYVEQNLTLTLSRARKSVEAFVREIGDNRIGLFYIDRNGFIRYLFDMKLISNYSTGGQITDRNAYSWRFTRMTTKIADYIAGAIDVDEVAGGYIGGTLPDVYPTRAYYRDDNFTGGSFVVPLSLDPAINWNTEFYLYRNGVKLGKDHVDGYSISGTKTLVFAEAFDAETMEMIYLPRNN